MQHINAIPFKKKIIPFVAFTFFILSVKVTQAQKNSSKLDSLLQAAQMPQHDTLLIFSYSRLAQELRNSNTDSANKYADKAIALSEKIKFTRGSVMSLYSKGLVLLMESKHQEAVGYFEQSKQHINSTGTKFMLPEYYNGCASAHDRLGNKSKALEMYLESARLFESENNDRKAAAAYNNISAIYRKDLNDADNALVYAKKSLALLQNSTEYVLKGTAYERVSTALLLDNKKDSALVYALQALQYFKMANSTVYLIAHNANVGNLYSRMGIHDTAFVYLEEAIRLGRASTYKTWLAHALNVYGESFVRKGIKDSALIALKEATNIAHEIKEPFRLKNSYEGLIKLFTTFNDYKNALAYNDSLYLLNDSLYNIDVTKNLNALNLKYETEKKEKEIALLSSDKKIQQLQLEKQNAELAGNKLLAKQKENEIELLKQSTMLKDFELKRSYDELREKTLDALFKEQKLKLAEQQQIINEKQFQNERLVRNSLIGVFIVAGIIVFSLFNRFQLKKKLEKQTALNNERLRIATELHDEVGSDLSGINVYSSVAKMQFEQDKNLATGTLNKISEHTQSTIQTMQDIVWAINPNNDSTEALIKQMKVFATPLMEAKNISFNLTANESTIKKKLNMEQRQHVYLIFKEAINNIIKYSYATQCTVAIEAEKNKWNLRIEDNGTGFSETLQENKREGNGLINMKRRSALLGGKIEIASTQNAGTKIELVF